MSLAANHSDALDPIGEAEAQLAGVPESAHTIVLLGAGLGFVTELAATRWPAATLIVLEPSAEIARVAMQRAPAIYQSTRVRVLVGPDYAGAGDLWKVFDRPEAADVSGSAVTRHRALMQTMPAEIARAYRFVARAIEAARMNRRAREENAGRYLLNTLRNLAAIFKSSDPSSLAGQFATIPAVVIGAGPSLDRQLDDLRAVADRAVIIAADTAWRPLVSGGIDPHFVVALDPTDANGRHLRDVHPSRETWGIFEGSVDPDAVSAFDGSLFTFRVGNHHPWPWIQTLGVRRPIVRAWGSVLTSALDLALAFKCNPVIFAGADLAFTDDRPYCRGTSFEADWARHTARGASLRQVWQNTLSARKLLTEAGVTGDPVLTAPHLIEFRNWIVNRANEALAASQRIINATPGGILSGGAVGHGDLRRLLTDRPKCDQTIRHIIRRSVASTDPQDRTNTLSDALTGVADNEVIGDWLAFGRPTLTLDAIHAGLAEARERSGARCETTPDDCRPSVAGCRPSTLLGTLSLSKGRMPVSVPRIHAADRVAHMRARLTDEVSGLDGCATAVADLRFGQSSPTEAMKTLTVALLTLPRLTTAWGEDVEHGSDPATVPLSVRYAWTATARPLVDALETWMLHPDANDRIRRRSPVAARGHFWGRPIAPTSDVAPSATAEPSAACEQSARSTLIEMSMAQINDRRSDRLIAVLDSDHGPPLHLDRIMRAMTGTIATPLKADGDPRGAFVLNEVGHIEPDVLSDRGLPAGWHVVTAGPDRARFTPRAFDRSLAIDPHGEWTPADAWPHPIVGEIPWGSQGGAIAWNSSERFILSRPHRRAEARRDAVPFEPSKVVKMADGALVWAALDGGLWEWTPGELGRSPREAGRFLIETPKCAGIRVDGDELVLAPIARDASGHLERRRLRHEFRYRIGDPWLRRADAGPEGPFASECSQGEWTARSHPYADLIALQSRDGRAFLLAVHSPLQVAWAGPSLVVTITDGVTLVFEGLADRVATLLLP